MRMLDCDCGSTLQAANDDDLVKQVRRHADEAHEDLELTDEQARELVTQRAYEASDS